MSREWKPGDVAMVTLADRTERIAMRDCDGLGWGLVGDPGHSRELLVLDARPLVVIDPENREQVERLFGYYIGARDTCQQTTGGGGTGLDWMRAALREYATPPKPDEPQGLGAVVEDADGLLHVRAGTNYPQLNDCWRQVTGDCVGYWRTWKNIDAVRVLSEGVTP